MEAMKKAAGYVRVSTTAQAKEGESLQTQKDSIALFCETHGLELIEIITDEGVSGKKQKRPGLTALLAGVKDRKYDCVISTRLTRFGRSAKDLLNNLSVLEENWVRFISLKESLDTSSPAGRLLRTVLAGVAEFEHDVIKDQLHENRKIRWSRGDIHMGKPPYGYTWDKEKKQFGINPDEAEIYNRIVSMYLDQNMGYKSITIKLREEGIRCKRAFFSPTVVGYILKNPCYCGRYIVNRKVYKGNIKTKTDKPTSENIIVSLPPLIDKLTWDKIQEKILFNKVKTKRTTIPEYFLRNVLQCGECGGSIKPENGRKRKDGSHYRYYQCYWNGASPRDLAVHGKDKKCPMPLIRAQELEDSVMYHLLHYLTFGGFTLKGEYIPAEIEQLVKPERYVEQILALSSQLFQFKRAMGRKETAKANLFSTMEESDFDKNQFLKQLQALDSEMQTLTALIQETESKLTGLEKAQKETQGLTDFVKGNGAWLRDIGEQILSLAPQDKQALIETMLAGSKIEVYIEHEPDGWDINNPPFSFNPNILQALADDGKLDKINHHQPGPRRHPQGGHRFRFADGGGYHRCPGPAAAWSGGRLSTLRRTLPGRPPQTHPWGALHGPGHPGGESRPHHSPSQRPGSRGGPGDQHLSR